MTLLDIPLISRHTYPVNTLNIDLVRAHLDRCAALEYYDEIGSTNDRAKQLAHEGAAGPLLIVADYQTAGHGRRGAQCAGQGNSR